MEIRDTRYVKTPDGVYIAYQVTGEGPIDLAWQFEYLGNVDLVWEDPFWGPWLRGLAGFCRVILHDRRGTGCSSRNVPLPNLETRVSDLRLVLDTVGSGRPTLAGVGEGGAPNVLLAATDPEHVRSIVWHEPVPRVVWMPDYPWGVKPDYVEHEQHELDLWGTNEYGAAWAETRASRGSALPAALVPMAGMLGRNTVTPDVARELSRIWYQTDVRAVLPSVRAPTLLLVEEPYPEDIEVAEYVASLMPDAEVVSFPGIPSPDGMAAMFDIYRSFLGIARAPELDTVLSTVLFTDIVGSTEKQAELGDHGWKDLVGRHHAIVREGLTRWHGVENDTAGDGFYATFDGPARAIRCALEVTERVRDLGIEVRAGVHTGECELIESKCAGITVSIGARVASNAGPSEVLVSQTVKDLVAGSGLSFEDRGEHELKGVPERWRLYAVTG